MKVIFLDIDGVLNCVDTLAKACRADVIDPNMVAQLNRIIKETGAKVVISSTWRTLFSLDVIKNKYLIPAGFIGEVIDKTPDLQCTSTYFIDRGIEIQAWLENHPEVTSFVILDDDSDMHNLISHLVQTTFEPGGGLHEEHADKAIEMLSRPRPDIFLSVTK